jgi:hypothetical protein
LIPAIESHQASLGRTPRLVAADAGFYSAKNEALAKVKGVKRVCIPNRSSKSPERKRLQKKRWFRNGQKWRTGCEGRIRVVKRRHGLSRCRYKGAKKHDSDNRSAPGNKKIPPAAAGGNARCHGNGALVGSGHGLFCHRPTDVNNTALHAGIALGRNLILRLVDVFLLFFFRQVIKIFGQSLCDLLLLGAF